VPVFRLSEELVFPDPELAADEGLLAVGGDLSPERLVLAYSQGIFPWFSPGEPYLWWSPDPRLVLEPKQIKLSRSLKKVLRKDRYQITADTAFEQVIRKCSTKPRPDQEGTWITDDMHNAYVELHRLGYAHSVESWLEGELVGGLYGVSLGTMFFGESMYADHPDASKCALAVLAQTLVHWNFELIDCQVDTPHLRRFGAYDMNRQEFVARVRRSCSMPSRVGVWQLVEKSKLSGT
jgi:leucyl/phenylalanyl-tRNA--protein transferase